jgi:hypothetical protein
MISQSQLLLRRGLEWRDYEANLELFAEISGHMDTSPPYRGLVGVRSANEADNKIADEWMEEYKGRITPEPLAEYHRRVLKSVEQR